MNDKYEPPRLNKDFTEEEFDCTLTKMNRNNYDEEKMYQALLEHVEKAIKAMIRNVSHSCGRELEEMFGRSKDIFQEVLSLPFLRISYEEAIGLLKKTSISKFDSSVEVHINLNIIVM